jgi:hypothetical protein
MAVGNYGIVRPADVSPSDIEIFYTYTPSRDLPPQTPVQTLDANTLLTEFNNPNRDGLSVLGGLYNLNLPSSIFSNKGFYTIMIRPREISLNITDCGVLSAFPDIKGLVFNAGDLPFELTNNNSLVGYRIEYLEGNNKVRNTFRVITSSNQAEAVSQNISNTTQKAVRYRFRDGADLVFCTLTPSSASNVTPNRIPFIGEPGQQVILTNTNFNPVVIELEMVEHDIETLAYGLFGNQSKSIVDGIYTIYDFDNRIYKQYNLFEVQDEFTDEPLFEIREERDEIDNSKDFDDITNVNPEGGI